jgi:hypothetical protein
MDSVAVLGKKATREGAHEVSTHQWRADPNAHQFINVFWGFRAAGSGAAVEGAE